MNHDLAKINRLGGKFNFKMRDWQRELDEETGQRPHYELRRVRPARQPEIIWRRRLDNDHCQLSEEHYRD